MAIIFSSCSEKVNTSKFSLSGNLTNSKGETLYFEKLGTSKAIIIDSVILDENGHFEFNNYVPKIGFYRIKTNQQNFAMLVLDSADHVTISGNLKDLGNTYKVQGSEETKLFIDYNEIAKNKDLKLDSLNKAFQSLMAENKLDAKKMDSLSFIFEGPYNKIIQKSTIDLINKINKNTSMYASIMAIQSIDPDNYSDVYRNLDVELTKKFRNDKNVAMFHEFVNKMLSTTIGQIAPEINLPDLNGKDLPLSSFRGKVVLIDFWASWCKPCLAELPNVINIYKKYKNNNFEIYGVSLDQDRNQWLDAIKKNNLTWPQVSDLKYWDNVAAKLYNIQSIPYTVLINKEGKIIAKNLKGIDLEKKISELLN